MTMKFCLYQHDQTKPNPLRWLPDLLHFTSPETFQTCLIHFEITSSILRQLLDIIKLLHMIHKMTIFGKDICWEIGFPIDMVTLKTVKEQYQILKLNHILVHAPGRLYF